MVWGVGWGVVCVCCALCGVWCGVCGVCFLWLCVYVCVVLLLCGCVGVWCVETHVRVVPVTTGTFSMYTRKRFGWTHTEERGVRGEGKEGGGRRQFCLPEFAHKGLSRAPEVHQVTAGSYIY